MTSTLSSKVERLLRRLLEETRAGVAAWEDMRPDPASTYESYVHALPSGAVVLGQTPTGIRLELRDAEGREIYKVQSGMWGDDEDFRNARLAEELFDLARSNALQIESTVDAMLRDLGET